MLKIINKLFEEVFSKDLKIRPQATYSKLKVYIGEHFKYEEELFEKHKWYDREDHIKQHQDLIKDLESTKAKINVVDDYQGAIILLEFLKNWVCEHIMEHDKNYSEYLISRGVK